MGDDDGVCVQQPLDMMHDGVGQRVRLGHEPPPFSATSHSTFHPSTSTMTTPLLFSTFEITRQAFYRTPLAYAITNLKPIVPGRTYRTTARYKVITKFTLLYFTLLLDVLVCSTRPVPRLVDLRADELAELMHAVQRVGHVVERAYKADGLTIACQV